MSVPTTDAAIAASRTEIHNTAWCSITQNKIAYFDLRGNHATTERTARAASVITIQTDDVNHFGAEIPSAKTTPINIKGIERQMAPLGNGWDGGRGTRRFGSPVRSLKLSGRATT